MNTSPLNAWALDADGVITNINTHKADPRVLQAIITLLSKGEPVAIITGRSLLWVREEILTPLAPLITDRNFYDNLFVSAEFGGVHLEYRIGAESVKSETSLATPPEVKNRAKEILEKFSASMIAEQKQIISSFACKPGFSIDKFRQDQRGFAENLKRMLRETGHDHEFLVHTDSIGTNVKHIKLNKQFATEEMIIWLEKKQINPLRYNAIGDSQSDTEIAQELYLKGKNFEFVFVNEESKLDRTKIAYPVIVTTRKFTEGTLEFINSTLAQQQPTP